MREQLIGYLLGALEPEEQLAVESHLGSDPRLNQELQLLRRALDPLSADRGHDEPPLGLAQRTCEFVESRTQVLSFDSFRGSRGSWSLQDFAVAAGILIAATLLFFPAASLSRHNAHLAGCAFNMGQFSLALGAYSQLNQDYFPYIPDEGRLATGGTSAATLAEQGFVSDPKTLICPASPLAGREFRIPTLKEIHSASADRWAIMRRTLGGSYGYTLGHFKNGRYRGTKNLGRSTFALLADMPSPFMPGRKSTNHGTCGQNVLMESGNVVFVTDCRDAKLDDIYANKSGIVAPGVDEDDPVIADGDYVPAGQLDVSGDTSIFKAK